VTLLRKLLPLIFLAWSAGAQYQYKLDPAPIPPPEGLEASIAALLQPGVRVSGGAMNSLYCEIWFVKDAPSTGGTKEDGVAFPTLPQGALLGVIRFPSRSMERRGYGLKPGLYTLRYSQHPVDGDHQGAAPQRDFLILAAAATDPGPAARPKFEDLVEMSRPVSGTAHPAILELGTSSATVFPSLIKAGEDDWALQAKIGDLAASVILVGRHGH
jgi:hypothetical protein